MFTIKKLKKLKVSVLFTFFKKYILEYWIKNWEDECRIRFLRKDIFECQTKIDKKCDDDVLSRIKMCCKKNILCWKKKGFLRKMLVGIKDDRDSVTRWEIYKKIWT